MDEVPSSVSAVYSKLNGSGAGSGSSFSGVLGAAGAAVETVEVLVRIRVTNCACATAHRANAKKSDLFMFAVRLVSRLVLTCRPVSMVKIN